MDIGISDFGAYYATTRIWQQGGQPYDFKAQCGVEMPLSRTQCMPFAHPPLLLPLQGIVIDSDFQRSYWRWAALLITAVLASFLMAHFLLPHDLGASAQ